jgi:ubiquinone/menaquinone biosynthesis C-methylase UbiE
MENDNRGQILNVIKYLSLRKVAPTRAAILDAEPIREWDEGEQLLDSELGELVSDCLLVQSDEVYSLTPEGRKLAQQKDAREFGKWMITCEHSAAYREFCRELYGSDRCQFNMMTQIQLEKLLDVLNISKCQSVLDIGCGTGALTEHIADHIADHIDGHVTGIDFSSEAIKFAQKKTMKKQDRLTFQVMDMDEITFPSNSFDTVISIDTLYFASDLNKTIDAIRDSLQEQGQMGIFYSPKITEGESQEMLGPENSVLAKILRKCGLQFETWDFTAEEKELWERSVSAANEFKKQFIDEGNLTIYEGRISEATRELELFDKERRSRYLYHAWL